MDSNTKNRIYEVVEDINKVTETKDSGIDEFYINHVQNYLDRHNDDKPLKIKSYRPKYIDVKESEPFIVYFKNKDNVESAMILSPSRGDEMHKCHFLAHELGHVVLHCNSIDEKKTNKTFNSVQTDEAAYFADSLLKLRRNRLKKFKKKCEEAISISTNKTYKLLHHEEPLSINEIEKLYDGYWIYVVNAKFTSKLEIESGVPVIIGKMAYDGAEDGIYEKYKDKKYEERATITLLHYDENFPL